MTLVESEEGTKILIDMNIRNDADDPNSCTPDVAKELRDRLVRDSQRRLFVDVLLISHPDEDHCRGLSKHFHLGPPDEWSPQTDKILIREVWSSPMVFRRASRQHVLCDDAKAFNSEARRRARKHLEAGRLASDGNRILILGEDEEGKTNDLQDILVRVDMDIVQFNGQRDNSIQVRLLAPFPEGSVDDEELLKKNNSSTILRFALKGDGKLDACRFLTGGDAKVAIWEKLWDRHSSQPDWFSYDILLCPHHCSWHSLSYDSWNKFRENGKVSPFALNALSQARDGATIVVSSNPILDDDNDPPCIGAKRVFEIIAAKAAGSLECVGERPSKTSPGVLVFEVGAFGPCLKTAVLAAPAVAGANIIGQQALPHGKGKRKS